MCVAILDLSHSVLAMDFSPRLSFGCFNYQAFPSQLSQRLGLVEMDFFVGFETFGLGIVKLCS